MVPRELLTKYAQHVEWAQGTTLICDYYHNLEGSEIEFTNDEIVLLEDIHNEINPD